MKTMISGIFLLTAAALPGAPWSAEAPSTTPADGPSPEEAVVWRGAPVRVDLPLNQERIIRIPGAGRLRAGLLGGPVPGLRVQALGDHLYLLAREPFASTRMIVQSDDREPVLLDLAADRRFSTASPLAILAPAPRADADAAGTISYQPQNPPPPVGYVTLVRHAAQSLYAPPRLIPKSKAVIPAPLNLRRPVPLLRGGAVEAMPVASWRAQGPDGPLWVTAVRVQNRADEPLVLDPRDLRGDWRAASFQHARLARHGDEADTTTAYLVSGRPFKAVIAPWVDPPAPPGTGGAPGAEPDGKQAEVPAP